MAIESISYEVAGVEYIGTLATPDSPSQDAPAVLLAHEGPGIDDHVRRRATRLATLGYVAFALDYHGGGVQVPYEQMAPRLEALRNDIIGTRQLAAAGLAVLLAQPSVNHNRVAAIGYCFGGALVLELARHGADLKAVVGFHAGLPTATIEENRQIRGRILICAGAADPIITQDQRVAFENNLHESGVTNWSMEIYGGVGHTFTNPEADIFEIPGIKYDATADTRSWSSMIELLNQTIEAP